MDDHHPERRFDKDGLSGASVEFFDMSVSKPDGAFFLRANGNPRFTGDPGREGPAVDEDSEPDIGYGPPGPSLLVRLSKPRRSSSERMFTISPSRPRGRYFRRPS